MRKPIVKFDMPRREHAWADDFPFSLVYVRDEHEFPLHTHAFTELVIVLNGHAVHVTTHGAYPIHAGDVFVINGADAHGYKQPHNLDLVNVKFDPRHFLQLSDDVRRLPGFHALFTLEPRYRKEHQFRSRLRLRLADLAYVESILARLRREELEQRAGFRSMIRALFSELIITLSRLYAEHDNADVRPLLRLGAAISHLENHFTEEISIPTLAKLAHLSERHFHRSFRDATGLTPLDYLIRRRILKACELLRASDASITDIAFGVGFQDSSYFTAQFKKAIGVTPREFRKRL